MSTHSICLYEKLEKNPRIIQYSTKTPLIENESLLTNMPPKILNHMYNMSHAMLLQQVSCVDTKGLCQTVPPCCMIRVFTACLKKSLDTVDYKYQLALFDWLVGLEFNVPFNTIKVPA